MPRKKPPPINWSSAPDDRRRFVEIRWTLHRSTIDAVRAAAEREGVTAAALVERLLREALALGDVPAEDAAARARYGARRGVAKKVDDGG